MIVKKVTNPRATSTKAARVGGLVDYIRSPENTRQGEKCTYSNAKGFILGAGNERAEMIALAQEATKSRDPINHYILSFHEGELPSPAQVDEAVQIFLDELGLSGHQVIYGLHNDTDNVHVHIAVNRVHQETLKPVKINKGFDIEVAHKAIARIEQVQGWKREQNARYQVLEDGEIGRGHHDPEKPRQPGRKKQDMENRTGEKSAERIAIEDGAPIIKAASTWEQLHRELAANGMRYERFGSGAMIYVGDVPVKASNVDRSASFSKMQARLGAYQPAKEIKPDDYYHHTQKPDVAAARTPAGNSMRRLSECRVAKLGEGQARARVLLVDARLSGRSIDGLRRNPGRDERRVEPIKPEAPGWKGYITQRKAHYAAKADDKTAQAARQEQERKALADHQKAKRDEVLKGNWKGKGDLLNAMRSVMAAEQAAEKVALREAHKREREAHSAGFQPFPDFEQWLRQQRRPDLAENWRHRDSEPQQIKGTVFVAPEPHDIRAYRPEIVGKVVHYTRIEEAGRGGGVSFVDAGAKIDIHDWRNRDTTLAALQLSAQKWGSFVVTGNDDYKAMCVKLAAEHGFKITNPELQEGIQRERERLQAERRQAMKSEQLQQFERYADAVGAERYRVTSIKMQPDGRKQTFILDKKDGVTNGFTPAEIEQRTPEMQRLQRRGENLYYTPLSDRKHHILIDDMDRAKLERLISDGYQPAAVLESSPGNYQAIITVPKLGTPHDKDVGNRLSDALNRAYGDPKLSGAIHPHRAPGYENRKPKHKREDGSYPEVRLLKAERRECVKTLAMSREIDAEYQQQAAAKAQEGARKALQRANAKAVDPVVPAAGQTAQEAYRRHSADVLTRQAGGAVDLSRVDSMVAVRMRVTGYDQGEIAAAIRQCAPALRETDEGRDWGDYAERTARYAFGAAGDRQADQLAKYRAQWVKLEGREPAPKIERQEIPLQKREKEGNEMATQADHELVAQATAKRAANPKYRPNADELKAVDAVLVEQAAERLAAHQEQPKTFDEVLAGWIEEQKTAIAGEYVPAKDEDLIIGKVLAKIDLDGQSVIAVENNRRDKWAVVVGQDFDFEVGRVVDVTIKSGEVVQAVDVEQERERKQSMRMGR